MGNLFGRLAPVGSRVIFDFHSSSVEFVQGYAGYTATFLNSGTAALAAALIGARYLTPERSQVLLPGYACPDLVSAVVYAGLEPVLVDLVPDTHGMDQDHLMQSIHPEKTLAVIAVNFLGIPDQLEALSRICIDHNIFLVEDNAQAFPVPGEALYGDFVITSFGRGKPVSLLGGGMLLSKASLKSDSRVPLPSAMQANGATGYRFKAGVYNRLIFSPFYGLIEKLPFLNIGETKFKPLESVDEMPSCLRALLDANVASYLARGLSVQAKMAAMLRSMKTRLLDIPVSAGLDPGQCRLLRYPVLMESADLRKKALQKLNTNGLGASAMYRRPLPDIAGVKAYLVKEEQLPRARNFAERLITLPLHEGVHDNHIEAIKQVLSTA